MHIYRESIARIDKNINFIELFVVFQNDINSLHVER